MWFHAEAPGAHVVMRAVPSRATQADIDFAARIAALDSDFWGMHKLNKKARVLWCRTGDVHFVNGTYRFSGPASIIEVPFFLETDTPSQGLTWRPVRRRLELPP
mmetsp:Transcript_18878/g.53779  ORF Transcript_18878/g.53779 Transcript_18878/m.53779 type:complete len:104 (-) Transcript_18878:104-415(-)